VATQCKRLHGKQNSVRFRAPGHSSPPVFTGSPSMKGYSTINSLQIKVMGHFKRSPANRRHRTSRSNPAKRICGSRDCKPGFRRPSIRHHATVMPYII